MRVGLNSGSCWSGDDKVSLLIIRLSIVLLVEYFVFEGSLFKGGEDEYLLGSTYLHEEEK